MKSFQITSCIRRVANLVKDKAPKVAESLENIYVDDGTVFGDAPQQCNAVLRGVIENLEEYEEYHQQANISIVLRKFNKNIGFVVCDFNIDFTFTWYYPGSKFFLKSLNSI